MNFYSLKLSPNEQPRLAIHRISFVHALANLWLYLTGCYVKLFLNDCIQLTAYKETYEIYRSTSLVLVVDMCKPRWYCVTVLHHGLKPNLKTLTRRFCLGAPLSRREKS